MKTVYLLRHAKSSWDQPALEDFRRPLAPRGRKAAPRMGRFMSREGLIPDRVLCSGATRARETWDLVYDTFSVPVAVEILDDIYHGSPDTLLHLIRELPDHEESVLLIGHNPTFEDLASRLAGNGNEKALQDMAAKFPTAALAILDFPVSSWRDVGPGNGSLRDFILPKALE